MSLARLDWLVPHGPVLLDRATRLPAVWPHTDTKDFLNGENRLRQWCTRTFSSRRDGAFVLQFEALESDRETVLQRALPFALVCKPLIALRLTCPDAQDHGYSIRRPLQLGRLCLESSRRSTCASDCQTDMPTARNNRADGTLTRPCAYGAPVV